MFELEQLFRRSDAVQRHLAAPLARSRLAYLRYRAELGAKPSTLRGIAAAQLNAIRYLDLAEDGKVTPSAIADAAERWMALDPRRRGGTSPNIRSTFIAQSRVGCASQGACTCRRRRPASAPPNWTCSPITCDVNAAGPRPRFAIVAAGRTSYCGGSAAASALWPILL